jgi:mRNA-degrading endonuclease RelE of RelBE toxin-antitoxin system
LFVTGAKFFIYELARGERRLVSSYLETLTKTEKEQITSLFERLADEGVIWDERKFKNEEDGIWAFKYKKVRVYCFFDENRVVLLTNGADKKRRKANREDLKRAKNIREEYYEITGRGAKKK